MAFGSFAWTALLPELLNEARLCMSDGRRWMLSLTCMTEQADWTAYKAWRATQFRHVQISSRWGHIEHLAIEPLPDLLVAEGDVRLLTMFVLHDRRPHGRKYYGRHENWIHHAIVERNLAMATWLIADPLGWLDSSHSCQRCVEVVCRHLPLWPAIMLIRCLMRDYCAHGEGGYYRWDRVCDQVSKIIIAEKRRDIVTALSEHPLVFGNDRTFCLTDEKEEKRD